MIFAGFLADLQPQIMSGRLAQQGLAATGRTKEQKAFGHRMVEPLEKFRMQERQLN